MLDLFGRQEKSGDELMVITGSILETYPVREVTAETVEAGEMILPRSGLMELITPSGRRVWIGQADLPARIQAEEIRRLRHSTIMRSLFSDPGPDIARTPWQVWAIVLICLIFLGWAAVR